MSTPRIGPGALVVVVGPSGAGKDTLITRARTLCADDPCIVFPRRIVTRTPSATEDHDCTTPSAFAAAVEHSAFAFWWEAHGLKYALPAAIDAEIACGKTVVCNVSRGIVGALRALYANLAVVLVTAPEDVLLSRLAARGREAGGDVAERLSRSAPPTTDLAPDAVIENVGEVDEGARRLAALLRAAAGE
jgi:ribose 1,5-bisphosphokinase